MRISIQLQQDNGTVVRAVTKEVPQAATDRIIAALRNEMSVRTPDQPVEGMSAADLFELWANHMAFQDLKNLVTRVETKVALDAAVPVF